MDLFTGAGFIRDKRVRKWVAPIYMKGDLFFKILILIVILGLLAKI